MKDQGRNKSRGQEPLPDFSFLLLDLLGRKLPSLEKPFLRLHQLKPELQGPRVNDRTRNELEISLERAPDPQKILEAINHAQSLDADKTQCQPLLLFQALSPLFPPGLSLQGEGPSHPFFPGSPQDMAHVFLTLARGKHLTDLQGSWVIECRKEKLILHGLKNKDVESLALMRGISFLPINNEQYEISQGKDSSLRDSGSQLPVR